MDDAHHPGQKNRQDKKLRSRKAVRLSVVSRVKPVSREIYEARGDGNKTRPSTESGRDTVENQNLFEALEAGLFLLYTFKLSQLESILHPSLIAAARARMQEERSSALAALRREINPHASATTRLKQTEEETPPKRPASKSDKTKGKARVMPAMAMYQIEENKHQSSPQCFRQATQKITRKNRRGGTCKIRHPALQS